MATSQLCICNNKGESAYDDFFPESIVDLPDKCLEDEDAHQQPPKPDPTSRNNRYTSGHLEIAFTLISSMNSIHTIPSFSPSPRLGSTVQIGDIFRPESAYSNRLASPGTPLNCEFTFTNPPISYECSCVE